MRSKEWQSTIALATLKREAKALGRTLRLDALYIPNDFQSGKCVVRDPTCRPEATSLFWTEKMLRVKARMGKRHPALSVAILCAALVLSSVLATASDYGSFVGRVLAEWLDDGRLMRLEEPFEYVGPDRRRWPVPKGTIVDGASIPRPLWSVIGGPFEAKYRNASVVHD